MPPKRNGISTVAIEQLITQCVADALLDYEMNQNNGNGNNNRNGSHDLGSGSRRPLHNARGLKYATTLLGGALTWWNAYVRTVGHDAAYEMS
ncbi:hypothetical protein Tco_0729567 [Tanacetum coccineum]|uniref:Reverse transcriptase domain-containing protein n=1 Tax=Tanacetum coccineum TaxID=301880 RepID=A0ABQ4YQE6_9ASTR